MAKWSDLTKNKYGSGKKRIHRYEKESLAIECIKNGTLDVCLETGKVYTMFRGKQRERKLTEDKDGYMAFHLNVEAKDRRRGREERDGDRVRKRRRMFVMVHRIVLAKKLAVERYGKAWRENIRDLPIFLDVDHDDRNRANNAASNLFPRDFVGNRTRRPKTEEEEAMIEDALSDF